MVTLHHVKATIVARVSATPDLPPPGSTIRRTTARVLPVDASGRVLLLHGWDPKRPEAPYWFTIGGALEEGETPAQAGARELLEETGLAVSADSLGEPITSSTIEFDWGDYHLVQDQTFFAVRVEGDVSFDGHDAWERATIDDHAWWTAEELDSDGGAAHPHIVDAMRLAVARLAG